jgi:hypothetical protein
MPIPMPMANAKAKKRMGHTPGTGCPIISQSIPIPLAAVPRVWGVVASQHR